MANQTVPFTVVYDTIGLDSARYNIHDVMPGAYDYYWLVVIDRTNLQVVANAVTEDGSVVPPAVKKFDGNNKYILVVTSYSKNCSSQPIGELDTFIKVNGGGIKYEAIQQIASVVGKVNDTSYNYLMVSVMGSKSEAIEVFSIGSATLNLPMELMLIECMYSPELIV